MSLKPNLALSQGQKALMVGKVKTVSVKREGKRWYVVLTAEQEPPEPLPKTGSVVGIDHKAATAWLPGNPFASLVRGIEIRVTLDEEGFVGSGIHVFANVLDRFLGLYVHANSFTQLVIASKRTGEEILRCLPRSGDSNLV